MIHIFTEVSNKNFKGQLSRSNLSCNNEAGKTGKSVEHNQKFRNRFKIRKFSIKVVFDISGEKISLFHKWH